MSTQSFPVHEALPVNEKSLTSEKPAHRTSIFKELDDVPRVWDRESQTGYRGKRVLSAYSDREKEDSIDGVGGGHEGLETVDIGRQPMPSDYGYEMPERYGGKGVSYGDDFAIPLAGNNNTWVPPSEEPKRICGFGQRAFWIIFGIVCILVIFGAVAAGVVASKAAPKSFPTSGAISSSSSFAISGALAPSTQTSITSWTSTMTLANGSVVLATQVVTSIQTITPQSTPKSQASLSASTIAASEGSTPTTTPSATPGSASPTSPAATSSALSEQVSPSTPAANSLPTTTPSPTFSVAPHSSSPQIL